MVRRDGNSRFMFLAFRGSSANHFCDTSGCGLVEIEVSQLTEMSRDFLRSALRRNGAAETQSRGSALGSRRVCLGGGATAGHQLADN